MEDEIRNISILTSTDIPKMCWECRAMLRKIVKFQERIKAAYKYFTSGKSTRRINLLSGLSYSYTDQYISAQHEDDNIQDLKDIKYDELIADIQTDNISVKEEELSDSKYDEIDDVKHINYDVEIKTEIETAVKEECSLEFIENEFDLDVIKKEWQKNKRKIISEKIKKAMSAKYKIIFKDDNSINFTRHFKKVSIDDKERLYWSAMDKNVRNFRTMAYTCNLCTTGYAKSEYYAKHMRTFHSKTSGNFECDICKRKYKCKSRLKSHIIEHFSKYVCTICKFETYKLWTINGHLDCAHRRAVMCLSCGLKFEKRPEFYDHYKKMHSKVICDTCGKKYTKKQSLIQHIVKRHSKHRCHICKRDYSSLDALTRHNNLHHVISRTEHCYCVECDIQFDNMSRYTTHLKTSIKHKPIVGIPCPECNKVYNKKCTMNNHYNHVHLRKTKFYCDKCKRYFLNGFRLRQHIASVHDKIPQEKNKICPHCGRGFSTNRILTNHIRTHTGERPYSCEICQSTFTQKTALKVHKRAIHKIKD
ncbi:unnamed protein product, partial [Brenthis ino]